MPEMFDWRRVADPRVVRRAAEVLRRRRRRLPHGNGLPPRRPRASAPMRSAGCGRPTPARRTPPCPWRCAGRPRRTTGRRAWVRSAADWRSFWPGPVTLECGEGVADGLAGRLPDPVRRHVCPDGRLQLRCPAHEAVLATLRRLGGPLVLAAAPAPPTPHRWCRSGRSRRPGRGRRRDAGGTADDRRPGGRRLLEGGPAGRRVRRRRATAGGLLILFVCTGNTCRSPLAEGLFKARLAERLGWSPPTCRSAASTSCRPAWPHVGRPGRGRSRRGRPSLRRRPFGASQPAVTPDLAARPTISSL